MPWFLYALIGVVAVAVIAGLLPRPKVENARASSLGDFNFPRAEEGTPWPLIYGKVKVKGPNTLFYGALRAVPIVVTGPRRYGLFGPKSKTVTGHRYYLAMAMGLTLGPDVRLRRIWAGEDICWEGDVTSGSLEIDKPNLFGDDNSGGGVKGFARFYNGQNNQAVDPLLASLTDGVHTSRMPMKCWIMFDDFYFGTSPAIKPFYFELERYPNTLGIPDGKHRSGDDTNLVEILYDVIVNPLGRRGTDPAKINVANWRAIAVTLYDEGNAAALKLEASNTGRDTVSELLRQMDAVMYTDPSTGLIELRLIRNDYNLATIPHYREGEIVQVRNYSKPNWEETSNQLRVKFIDREAGYTSRPVMEQDMANINMQQNVRAIEMDFPACYSRTLAQKIAGRELALVKVPFTKAEINFNRMVAQLRPGDVFRYSFADYGIAGEVVRVQGFDIGSLEDGTITAIVIQDRFVYGDSSAIVPPGSSWTPPTYEIYPPTGLFATRAPYWFNVQLGDLDTDHAYVFFFAETGGGGMTDSYKLFQDSTLLEDGQPYASVPTISTAMPATSATLATLTCDNLPASIPSVSDAQIREGWNLGFIGGEYIAFRSRAGSNLQTVYRGIFGTTPLAHPVGTRLFILGSEGEVDTLLREAFVPNRAVTFTAEPIGVLNAYGGDKRASLAYTPPSIPASPGGPYNLRLNGSAGTITVGAEVNFNVSFQASDRLDKVIVLPGDALPPVPPETVFRGRIVDPVTSAILTESTWEAVGSYAMRAPATPGTYRVEVAARLSGIYSAAATIEFLVI